MTPLAPHLLLILAGGGDAPDSRPLDVRFAGWLGPEGRLLYLPVASGRKAAGYAGHLAWITSVFTPLGVADIRMWAELEGHTPAELEDFSGVYIGGGNTFRLLHLLRRTGFDVALRRAGRCTAAVPEPPCWVPTSPAANATTRTRSA